MLIIWLLTGCAMQPVSAPAGVEDLAAPVAVPVSASLIDEAEHYWWYVRFRMEWPEDAEALWYPDVLLADRVLRPVLVAQREQLPLWRVHRRAARDGAGRQFSFIFYTTSEVAAQINAQIAADPWVAWLMQEQVLARVVYDDPAKPQRPLIEDTSDRNWTPEMQRAWPHFIMGVSELWLGLIAEYQQDPELPLETLARYQALSETLDQLWRHQGGHALIHHLSAVFAYREVEIIRREAFRF